MSPRNGNEWAVTLCTLGLAASAFFWFAVDDVYSGFMTLMLAASIYSGMLGRRAAFLAGWFGGRADLVGQLQEAQDKDAATFVRRMMDRDMQVMANHLGEREMRKFISRVEMKAARHIARSDGSHDDL